MYMNASFNNTHIQIKWKLKKKSKFYQWNIDTSMEIHCLFLNTLSLDLSTTMQGLTDFIKDFSKEKVY